MPVSRKRKKKSSADRRSPGRSGAPTPSRAAQANPFRELLEHRQRIDEHRTALAAETAGPMIDSLIAAAHERSDDDLEDDFCHRYGMAMAGYEAGPAKDMVNPDDFVRATLSVLDERLRESGGDVAAVERVLSIVAGVLPAPLGESARGLAAAHLGDEAAQRTVRGRALTGPALWTHDVYGVRWAVVAPFAAADGTTRWYLWDVDTCGYLAVTVASGFHPSAEDALAEWQQAVGPAAAAATLTPAIDAETLDSLLSDELEEIRHGGESQAQHTEFLRGRRLGAAVREAADRATGPDVTRLTVDIARAGFADRLRELGHRDRPVGSDPDEGPADAGELAAELSDSWFQREHPTLYPRCSPHKVAGSVLHLRNFYRSDFAAELVAVLPEWIRFLAEHTGMAEDLTERCIAYASGDLRFPGLLDERGQPDLMARVME